MEKVLNLYKPLGVSPLFAINLFREGHFEYCDVKMSYPGRLDPMAEGVLLVLVDDENKLMTEYMKLDKGYEAEIILGFATDSLDLLGVAEGGLRMNFVSDSEIRDKLEGFRGDYDQELPVYSSYVVCGKPLWTYARSGKLDEIEIPRTKVRIDEVDVREIYEIGSDELFNEIERKVELVKGDFRQKEIIDKWRGLLVGDSDVKYKIVKVRIKCGSGTYIRAIARDFGKEYGGGVLFSLKRTCVGEYYVEDSLRV